MCSDFTRPSTWRKYHSGLCLNCHADCCCLPVEITIDELVQLELADRMEIEESLDRVWKRLKKEGIIRLFDRKRGMMTLNQKVDSSCIFLDKDRRCSVYEKRPATCRNFPRIGPRPTFCPWNNSIVRS